MQLMKIIIDNCTCLLPSGGVDSNELTNRLAPLASSTPEDRRRRSGPLAVAKTSSSDVPLRRKQNSIGMGE